MKPTAPQKRVLSEMGQRQPTIEDYKLAIRRKPGALEHYLRLAKKRGVGNNDLKALLGFALKEKIIDMPTYKLLEGELELAKTRRHRKTGKMDPRDSAIRQDDDDEMTVQCVGRGPRCSGQCPASQATYDSSRGWICPSCK